MRDGRCPRCGSDAVHNGTEVFNKGGTYGSNSIPITFWSYAPLDNYVCVDCGYVESYVGDEARLREIAEKWPRQGGGGGITEDGETRKLRQ